MEASVAQIVGIGLSVGAPLAAGVVGVLRWSICRNIAEMDRKLTEMGDKVDKLYQRQEVLQRESISRSDCAVCRRECQARIEADGKAMIDWMRRVEDKFDKLLMMVANLNNGQGGVKNGLS